MKDRPLMCVTQVLDDDTGIWANDLCEFAYHGIVEDFIRAHKQKGVDEILSMLECLKRNTLKDWERIKKEN